MCKYIRLTISCLCVFAILTFTVGGEDDLSNPGKDRFQVMNLLQRVRVRAELELVDLQIERLIELEVERQLLYSSPLGRLEQETIEERREAFEEFKRQLGQLETKAMEVLLPSQQERLKQLILQEIIIAGEVSAGLTTRYMASRLEIDSEQAAAIRAKAMEAVATYKVREEELHNELAKAKEIARKEVLSTLTASQRKQYEELIGQPFDLMKQD